MSINYKKFVALIEKYNKEQNKDKQKNKNKLAYKRVFNKGKRV
jgi:hypothetical protein